MTIGELRQAVHDCARYTLLRSQRDALLAALDVVEELAGFDLQKGYGAEWKTAKFADAVHGSLNAFAAALEGFDK